MSIAPGTSTTSKRSNAASLSTSDMGTKQRERGLSKVSTKEVSKTSKGLRVEGTVYKHQENVQSKK